MNEIRLKMYRPAFYKKCNAIMFDFKILNLTDCETTATNNTRAINYGHLYIVAKVNEIDTLAS